MILVKESDQPEIVTDSMMSILNQMDRALHGNAVGSKIELIKMLRTISKIQNGAPWGLKETKIFIENNFTV